MAASDLAHVAPEDGRFVICNATTLSLGMIDTELFGHRAYITDGKLPAQSGLLDEAEGGFFFLDAT